MVKVGPGQYSTAQISHATTERRPAQPFAGLLLACAEAANRARTVGDALPGIVDAVTDAFGWPVGHALIPEHATSGSFRSAGIWSTAVREGGYGTFRYATARTVFAPGSGLPGRVAADAQLTWVSDLDQRDWCLRSQVTDGLRTAVSMPVLHDGRPVVVLEFLTPATVDRNDAMAAALEQVADLLAATADRGLAVEDVQSSLTEERDFVAVLSHELRSPLTSLKGFVHTLLSHWDELDDDVRLRLLERAGAATSRLHALVSDTLELLRAEDGRTPEVRFEEVDVADVLDEAVEDVRVGDQSIEVRVPDGLTVLGDRRLMCVVLTNLISNAKCHGELPIVVSAERTDGTVEMRVRDHGEGVAPEDVETLFERFVSRNDSKGWGLGLYIGRRLARLTNGDLHHEPADPGSAFVLSLPSA